MVVVPINDDVEAELRRRGVWPLAVPERDIPDEWVALLDQLFGQPARGEIRA